MRDMVAFILKKAGYEVGEAEDGKVALNVLAGAKFDLIITDHAVFEVRGSGLALIELAPGVTLDNVKAKTAASYSVEVGRK